MKTNLSAFSIALLRWTVGVVVLLESVQFVLSPATARFLAKAGLPLWLQPVLGATEIVAAILFLVPFTARVGSYLLLVIFVFAALVHFLHGQYNVGALAVYAAAVLVCLAHSGNIHTEVSHERI
jgi:uncharacterized membrane protein YphA (DoxX/SURF4 family)